MTRYITFLILLFYCSLGQSQDYLLDSLRSYSEVYFSDYPNIQQLESKFHYDDEKRLILRDDQIGYRVYTYSDSVNTTEIYNSETDDITHRFKDYLNPDGFEIIGTTELFIDSGFVLFTIDSLSRDQNNFLVGGKKYKRIGDELKLINSFEHIRDEEGRIIVVIRNHYQFGIDVYDYVFYKDSIEHIYDGDLLEEIHRTSYYTTGFIDECERTRYSYSDNYFEILEMNAEDEDCLVYNNVELTRLYYSDSEFYDYDSSFMFKWRDEAWELSRNEHSSQDMIDDQIVVYYGSETMVPISMSKVVYFYKNVQLQQNTEVQSNPFGFTLEPNFVAANGTTKIVSKSRKFRIEVYDGNGQLLRSRLCDNRTSAFLEAPNATGTYFIRMIDDATKNIAIKKLVVYN